MFFPLYKYNKILVGVLWVPKITLRVGDLLGLTKLRKVVIHKVMTCYNKRLQIKMSKEKRYVGLNRTQDYCYMLPSTGLAQAYI